MSIRDFDLLGELPAGPTTTVLEASAGTGKTFTLAGLVTRYVAEGHARLDEMLLITFGRAASQELRERVRGQLVAAAEALEDPALATDDLLRHLVTADADELAARRLRLRDALSGFDAATIATTHQFCQLVLASLGVAGDNDSGVTLVESLDELVVEIVDDLYLARFGNAPTVPFDRAEALTLARDVVQDVHAELRPLDPVAGTPAAERLDFARAVLAELEHRKRRQGILSFDDLLSRLADALAAPDAPARERMRSRWSIVMVDEFQDTDPVQWQVIERAFDGHATVVLIGDPKQAIYAFRGGDVTTYLSAAAGRDVRTLGTNWRSDRPLVERLQRVMLGAALGHPEIVVREVEAVHEGSRLQGAPAGDPFRLRVVTRDKFPGVAPHRTVAMDDLRAYVAADLAADIGRLLASGATYRHTTGEAPVGAGDVAVLVETHKDARACRDALAAAGIPAVYGGDADIFGSEAGDDWLALLEGFEQPHRSAVVRAAALTAFFGHTGDQLVTGGDALTDGVADTLRAWADHARERGVAAVFEAAMVGGMGERVLAVRGGDRRMTDLAHLAQLLHEVAHRDRLGLPALLAWLRERRSETGRAGERNRRLDSDARAVQILTVWVAKGLQYPLVYLPFGFNRYIPPSDNVLHHDAGVRSLHVGGKGSPGFSQAEAAGRAEVAGDNSRLTYVALTRAQSQVVAWWAPSWDEPNGGFSRLLRTRRPGDALVPERLDKPPSDAEAIAVFRRWEAEGGPSVEEARIEAPPALAPAAAPDGLGVRTFDREIDTAWRRTSYSGLARGAVERAGVASEAEVVPLDDEAQDGAVAVPTDIASIPSPMAELPSGAGFGSLVHAVLEVADPDAGDLEEELRIRTVEQLRAWPAPVSPEALAAALVPVHRTSLGPLAGCVTLAEVPLSDRLCEMEFELPLAGGDRPGAPHVVLGEMAGLLRRHLPADDPLLPYADRLEDPALGDQRLLGYLTGSIDVVLRTAGPRYLVVDYKTNRLGVPDVPLTAADYDRDRLTEAMLHSDYPLQALLYVVVLHRFLRWRQPGYDPATHLGGVLYLYLRGMCGPETPEVDGHPAGVFSWQPPAALVVALSDLLEGGSR